MSKTRNKRGRKKISCPQQRPGMVWMDGEWWYKVDLSKVAHHPAMQAYLADMEVGIRQGKATYCSSCIFGSANSQCTSQVGGQWVWHDDMGKGMKCLVHTLFEEEHHE